MGGSTERVAGVRVAGREGMCKSSSVGGRGECRWVSGREGGCGERVARAARREARKYLFLLPRFYLSFRVVEVFDLCVCGAAAIVWLTRWVCPLSLEVFQLFQLVKVLS